MDAYVDLSYILSIFIIITLPYYYKRIANLHFSILETIGVGVLFLVLYFNVFVFSNFPFINLIFIFIYFLILYKRKVIKYYFIFLFVYYSNVAIIMIFSSSIYIYHTLVFISRPLSLIYCLVELVNIILIEIILFSIKSIKLLKEYRIDLMIELEGRYRKFKGYIDSGNTLMIENLPVIFINEAYFKDSNKQILIKGIGNSKSKIFKTKVLIKGKEFEVICASSKKRFNGCDCLVNIHLMEG